MGGCSTHFYFRSTCPECCSCERDSLRAQNAALKARLERVEKAAYLAQKRLERLSEWSTVEGYTLGAIARALDDETKGVGR